MDRRVGKNLIAQQFGNVGIHKELDIANQRIEELTAEIEELKASGNKQSEKEKVIELHSSLREQGISSIPLFEIEPNPEQPRQTFSEESILLLARSLEQDGQQQPILLFQKETRRYFLFDGERRWRAAQVIGWKKIDAVIIPQRQSSWIDKPETLRRQAILTNHHRENLNPLDLAEALVKEIATIHQNFQEDEVPLLLDAVIARLTRRKSLDIVTLLIKVAQTTIARIENVSVSKMSMTDLKALENSLKQKLKEIEWALTKEADLNQSGQNKQ